MSGKEEEGGIACPERTLELAQGIAHAAAILVGRGYDLEAQSQFATEAAIVLCDVLRSAPDQRSHLGRASYEGGGLVLDHLHIERGLNFCPVLEVQVKVLSLTEGDTRSVQQGEGSLSHLPRGAPIAQAGNGEIG